MFSLFCKRRDYGSACIYRNGIDLLAQTSHDSPSFSALLVFALWGLVIDYKLPLRTSTVPHSLPVSQLTLLSVRLITVWLLILSFSPRAILTCSLCSHSLAHLSRSFSLHPPSPVLFPSILLFLLLPPSVFSLSLFALLSPVWSWMWKHVCMLILTWMMSTWCNENSISDALSKIWLDTNTTNEDSVETKPLTTWLK